MQPPSYSEPVSIANYQPRAGKREICVKSGTNARSVGNLLIDCSKCRPEYFFFVGRNQVELKVTGWVGGSATEQVVINDLNIFFAYIHWLDCVCYSRLVPSPFSGFDLLNYYSLSVPY